MAFRIHDSVVRGEIDNREKGIVRGRIWVHDRAEPVVLELRGNAHPDLAGCLLNFTNPLPTTPHPGLDSLHPEQRGAIGDLTASRKVRVFDFPVKEACLMIFQYQCCAAKCAGALGGLAYEDDLREPGFMVAGLKRALALLHESLEAADRVKAKAALPPEKLEPFLQELFAVREEILALMKRFRGEAP